MSMPQPLLTFAATPGMSSGSRGSTDPTHGPTARIDPRPPELATGGRVPARCDVREGHTSSLRKPSDIDACSGPGLRPSAPPALHGQRATPAVTVEAVAHS